jgi:hypothetical protein
MVDPPQEISPMNTPTHTPDIEISTQLHEGLQRFEAQWKRLQRRLGAGRFLLAAVALLVLSAGLDALWSPEGMARTGLSLGFYASLGLAAWFLWARPLFRPLTPEKIAWMIEDIHPELNEKLISAVEFEKERGGSMSRAMILRTIADTEVDLGRVDPSRELAPPPWLKALPKAVALILILLMVVPGLYLPLRIKRIMLPTAGDAAVTTYALRWATAPEKNAVENATVQVSVERTRDTGDEVILEVQGEQNQRIPLRWNAETEVFEGAFTAPNHPAWVFARSGGTSTRRILMKPLLRPWIENLSLEIHSPDHTGAPVRVLDTWPSELKVVENARIHIQVAGNAPLSQVEVVTEQASTELPLTAESVASGDWLPTQSGEVSLRVRDREGLEPQEVTRMTLHILPDLPPTVTWIAPESDVLLREGDSLPLVWTAGDDFGVTESRIEIRKNQDKPVEISIRPEAGRYTYDFSDWQLAGGDQLHVQALAVDALGQRGDSSARILSVAGGLDHPEAQNYLRDLSSLRSYMATAEPDLVSLQEARAGIFEAVTYETPSALENIEFNRMRWPLLTDRLGQHLNRGRNDTDALRRNTFFRKGAPALELLARYMEQERVRLNVSDPSIQQTDPGVAGVYELGEPLLSELEARALVALPALQAGKLNAMVSLVAPRTDPASRRLLEDLRHRAVLFATVHAPEEVERLKQLDLRAPTGKPARGLHRWMWVNQASYKFDPKDANGIKSIESRVNHSSLAGMGLNENQRGSLLWMGRLHIEKEGTYRFELESDDGSRFYVGEELVVKNDGNHAMETRSGEITLTPGIHPIRMVYFNSGGGGGMIFRWQVPGANAFDVVPPEVLFEPGDVGVMEFQVVVAGLFSRLERQASDLRELERWMARIRERLLPETETLPELLAAVEEELTPELSAQIQAEAAALRQQAEAEGDETLVRLADELERAERDQNVEALQRTLEAVAALKRDREQEQWEDQLREETQRALDLLKERKQASTLDKEIELQAQAQESADRLRDLAEMRPEKAPEDQLERELRDASRDVQKMAEAMEQADVAAMEDLREKMDAGLDRAEDASAETLIEAEDRLRAALPPPSEQLAASAERLAGADDAIAALDQERKALESVLQDLRDPLDLRREEDRRITEEDVRDQRLAEALERQLDQAVDARDPKGAEETLREMQPLLAAQDQARREALTRSEENALKQDVREATEASLSPEEAAAFDRMEQLAAARENVERLAKEVESLQDRPVPERLADEVARAQASLENPNNPPPDAMPRTRAEQAQLETALDRMQDIKHPLAKAGLQEEDGNISDARKEMEKAFRESEQLQNDLEKMGTPESARLKEMTEAMERQMRVEDVKGAEETLSAMQRQVDEWAQENPVAARLAEETEAAIASESGDPAQQMEQASEALERAARYEEAIPPALESAQDLAEKGDFGQAARELEAAGVEPELAEKARSLEAEMQSLQQEALRASVQDELGKREKQAMERLADTLADHDLRKANQYANEARNEGEAAKEEIARLQEEGQQLAEALEQAQQASENPHAAPAKEQITAASEALGTAPENAEAQSHAQQAEALAEKEDWQKAAAEAQKAAEAVKPTGEPGTPGEPGAPSEPGQPAMADANAQQPGAPGEPGAPSEPSAPGEPGQPAMADANAQQPGAPGQPGAPNAQAPTSPTGQPGPTSPTQAQAPTQASTPTQPPAPNPMQAAVEQLASAESALRQGDSPVGAEALQAASQSLAQAQTQAQSQAAAAAAAAMASSPTAPPSNAPASPNAAAASQPGTEPGQGQGNTPSTTESGGSGEGGSLAESQGGADPDLWKGPQSGNWEGARSDLETGDPRRAGQQYSPYYRRAIQQYMRELQEEQKP